MDRPEYNPDILDLVFERVKDKLHYRLLQKGKGIYMSSHEILGIITEEYDEYKAEVRANNAFGQEEELLDIAVGCVFGLASLLSNKMDWL